MEPFEAFIDRLILHLDPVDAPIPPGGATIHAAVVVLLRSTVNGSTEILFIRRAQREGDPWSGHIAFPGGRPEARDASLLAVALREAGEEVGIDVQSGRRALSGSTVGSLPRTRPPPIDVTPFVALAPEGADVRPDPDEVREAFWIPLSSLRRAGPSDVVRHVIRGECRCSGPTEGREWRAYPSPAGPVWGITERILTEFLSRAGGVDPGADRG
jgi:8-oxo-dGTP pyrophosphatase MutT (NUDIX family)